MTAQPRPGRGSAGVAARFAAVVAAQPHAPAVSDHERVWRYRQVADHVAGIAHVLDGAGVCPGEIVAVSVDLFAQVAYRRLTSGRDATTARAQEIYTDNDAAALAYLAGAWEPVATAYAELAGTGRTGGARSMASLAWTWRGVAWITFARWPLWPATVRPSGEKHAA